MRDYYRQGNLFGINDTPRVPTGRAVSAEGLRIVRLAFDSGVDTVFDYGVPPEVNEDIRPGMRVVAPFGRGNREKIGFCVELSPKSDFVKVKLISRVVDSQPLVDRDHLELARWISQYYCCPLGMVLAAMVPAAVKKQVGMVRRIYIRLSEQVKNGDEAGLADLRLSAAGRKIVDYLREHGGTAQDEIAAAVACGAGPFKTLAKSGVIELEAREELPGLEELEAVLPKEEIPVQLNPAQKRVFEDLEETLAEDKFNVAVLHGVTGSGKTEIYIRAIEHIIAQGKQTMVLVPEISLTPQTMSRFLARFKRVAVLHSQLNSTRRHQQWKLIAQGKADVVVGARSAIFAPLSNPGLIVVDEEHEPSYKQDSAPRYNGRDVAIKLAHMKDIPIILGSATPSLETYHNCTNRGHYKLLALKHRVKDLPLPPVTLIDMKEEARERKGRHLLSRALEDELKSCLNKGKQAILLLNRRGHSNFIYCNSCQYIFSCPNCDVSLTYHRRKQTSGTHRGWVMCHYCLHSCEVPEMCPVCKSKMALIGPGTQKAEDEILQKFPDLALRRVDSDSMKPGDYEQVLKQFGSGEIKVMLGTQMIGKGLDFPNVALVGVLNADGALSLPDFRSAERTFQLVAQVAGRCGRAEDTGRVIVQSYLPEEPSVKLACDHDFETFATAELLHRQRCQMPPYCRLARLILRDTKLEKLEEAAQVLRKNIDGICQTQQLPLKIRGPVPAGIARIENYHRQQILIQAPAAEPIQKLLTHLRRDYLGKVTIHVAVDVDPLNLM